MRCSVLIRRTGQRGEHRDYSSMSANVDEATRKLIADAADGVDKEGITTVEDGTGCHNELKFVQDMQFDRDLLAA